ncbi:Uma2 family endonuclease [Dactylosporangium sp. NPDC049525]|uniref:Uma2 family endonuclease n=1 Tax=Dactylosporangium sp. NPDC049525 TaxID=3154730 RepID=UPI00342FA740
MRVIDMDIAIPGIHLPDGLFTVDDVLALPETDQYRLELHEGVIRVVPPANPERQEVQLELAIYLRGLGRKVYTTIGIQIDQRSYRIPDIAVLRQGEAVTTDVLQSPDLFDLIIEVVSPGSVDEDRLLKSKVYADAGIPEYWRVENTAVGRVVVQSHLEGGHYRQVSQVALEKLLAGGGGLV